MIKKLIIPIIAILLLLPIVFAETRIHTVSLISGNSTYRNQLFVHFNANEFNSLRGGEALNFFVDYSCQNFGSLTLEEYNAKYPSHTITNITLKFIYSPVQTNSSGDTTLLPQINTTLVLSDLSLPFPSRKEFFNLLDKETLLVILDTKYFSSTQAIRDSFCRFDVFFGTEGCDRCREVEYFEFAQDVEEAEAVNDLNENIRNRISQFISINYEFAVILYWIVMIAILIFSIAILVYGVMFIYHFIVHIFGRK